MAWIGYVIDGILAAGVIAGIWKLTTTKRRWLIKKMKEGAYVFGQTNETNNGRWERVPFVGWIYKVGYDYVDIQKYELPLSGDCGKKRPSGSRREIVPLGNVLSWWVEDFTKDWSKEQPE